MTAIESADSILHFWRHAGPERWFKRDDTFDEACRERLLPAYEAAARGDLNEWELSAQGALALLLLLDQLPRNMFRDTRRAYATDAAAVLAAERAIERGFDQAVDPALQRFFYTPFLHAEELAHQERSVALSEATGNPDLLKWARHHHDIVARYGRFPHRNAVLGRESTAEERAFLATH